MSTQSEILPYFRRLLMALRRAVERLLGKAQSIERIQIQSQVLILVDRVQRDEASIEELAFFVLEKSSLGEEEAVALLQAMIEDLDGDGLHEEARRLEVVLQERG